MTRSRTVALITAGVLASFCANTEAANTVSPAEKTVPGLEWHSESLTYLYGEDFKVAPPVQQTFTFEHASGWVWGDVFAFVDQTYYNGKDDPANGHSSYYGEISPRLSMGKIFNRDLSLGPVRDILLAATYEFGEGDTESYLIGPGFDLNIPGFDYFQLNFYYRQPDGNRVPSGAWQITPVWSYTFALGNSDVLIDGYIDWVVNTKKASSGRHGQSDYHSNFHFNPQIKYDLGKALDFPAKKLYVGIEYDYWKNKYGIQDTSYFVTDQNTYSALIKYQF